MEFKYLTFGEAWSNSLIAILNSGEFVQSERVQKTLELRNVSLTSLQPFADPRIPASYSFSEDYINTYCKSFFHISPFSIEKRLRSYGPKKVNQIEKATIKLRNYPYTRRAVISLWDITKDIENQHPPCPVFVQFIIRSDLLEMTSVLRSSDAWMAAIPDFIALTSIQKSIADELKLGIGMYTQFSVSYHIYEFDLLLARDIFYEKR